MDGMISEMEIPSEIPEVELSSTMDLSDLTQPSHPPHSLNPTASFQPSDVMNIQEDSSPMDTPQTTSPNIAELPLPIPDISLDSETKDDKPVIPDILLVAESYPKELQNGMQEIARYCPHQNFVTTETMFDSNNNEERFYIRFTRDDSFDPGQYQIQSSHSNYKRRESNEKIEIIVTYNRRIEAFRALGRILGVTISLDETGNIEELVACNEQAQFDTLGAMIDCSRCAVLTIDSVFYILRCCALMGLNTFQLYTEDTYQIEDEPFFGYLRGGYSQQELVSIDNYGFDFGIEVFPCIQTLGHLGQILQWPRFATIRDTSEVLLANSEESYQFIEKMIESASRPFRSKRIHLGMDEANGIGEGRYKQLFGNKESTYVFFEHLQRVCQICKDKGLEPMVWSDMLFTLAAKNSSLQSYYDPDAPAPTQFTFNMPEDLELVYWDYYHVI